LKILFYFVFSKYFVGVFYFCNFKILFQSILHITDSTALISINISIRMNIDAAQSYP